MKVIVPMAGRGKRLRPHTLTTPKPLLPVGDDTIVGRLVGDLAETLGPRLKDVVFIIGDFGEAVEGELTALAERHNARPHIVYQREPLGTAHAVYQAADMLDGEIVIAFADTLFRANLSLNDPSLDGVIWVKTVPDPERYGVVTLNEEGRISNLVEKPDVFISDLAIIGVYYMREAATLRAAIERLFAENIKSKGEFQLTDALLDLTRNGARMAPGEVEDWLDCGHHEAWLAANGKVLAWDFPQGYVAPDAELHNVVFIPPYYIGPGAKIADSVIGPNVCMYAGAQARAARVENSIILPRGRVEQIYLNNSILGEAAVAEGAAKQLLLGDYSACRA